MSETVSGELAKGYYWVGLGGVLGALAAYMVLPAPEVLVAGLFSLVVFSAGAFLKHRGH